MKIRTDPVKYGPYIIAHSLIRFFEASLIVFIALAIPVQPISARGAKPGSRSRDSAGNTSTGSFTIMMNAATAQVQDLINQVKSAPLSTNLQIDPLHQLEDVQNALGTGQIATAVSNLNDFITRVNSLIGKSLTSSQANQLVQAANQIKATLGF